MSQTNSQIAKQLGSTGGKKSVQARFAGKTKEEISKMMQAVRVPKGTLDKIVQESLESLNQIQEQE